MPPKLYYPNADELRQWELRFHGPPVPVDETVWFQRYQPELLALANTDYGRGLLCLDSKRQRPEPIIHLTRNMVTYYLGQENGRHYKASDARSGAKWGNVCRSRWMDVNAALERIRATQFLEHLLRMPRLVLPGGRVLYPVGGGTTTTAYPAAGAVAPADGRVARETAGTFAEVRDGAGTNATAVTGEHAFGVYTNASSQFSQIVRIVFMVDFSAIADTDQKDSAEASYIAPLLTNDFAEAGSIAFVATTPGATNDVVTTDYGQFGTIRQATDRTIAGMTASTTVYNAWTVNAAGLTSISLTAISKFGWRGVHDADNTSPTAAASKQMSTNIYTADVAGTGQDPKIVLIHSVPVSSAVLIVTD